MYKSHDGRVLLAAMLALASASSSARAQEAIDVCLKSGETIRASRVDRQDSKYSVTPLGGSAAFTIPADQVRMIGAGCGETQGAPAVAPAPAVQQASPPPQAPVPQTTQAPAPDSPRFGVRGSSALGERLLPALIEAYAQKRGWKAAIRETGADSKEIELTAPGASQPAAVIDLKSGQSDDAAKALLDGSAAIGMSTRRLTAEEAAQFNARFQIDPLTSASGAEHVVALDAVAVIVHRDNPIKSLSLDQMARIFSGEIANWKDVQGRDDYGEAVRGPDRAIHLQTLTRNSDSYNFFTQTVFAGGNRAMAAGAQTHASSEAQSAAVAKDLGAIGFVEFPYITKNAAVSLTTSCGVTTSLSRFTVKTEQYPLARRLYLYTAGTPRQTQAQDFLQFALSDDAQNIAIDAGLVDQSVEYQDESEQVQWLSALLANKAIGMPSKQPGAAGASKPDDTGKKIERSYSQLDETTKYLARSSIALRFEKNSSNLDAKAVQDIDRLGRFMKLKGSHAGVSKLLGFADWDGSLEYNKKLSDQRAGHVKANLSQRGFFPKGRDQLVTAEGYSFLAPVACNDTDAGKMSNRRVEFWALDFSKND